MKNMTNNGFNDDALILVIGASSGIGKATVIQLNALGLKVVGVARREQKLQELKQECKNPDLFFYVTKDIGDDLESLPAFIKQLVAEHGKFSGYVHAVGVLNPQPLMMFDPQDAVKDFDKNLFSCVMILKELHRKKNRHERLDVVLVSSIAAKIGKPGSSTYAMTKASLNSLTVSLAKELGAQNIHINSVMPGTTNTEMAAAYNEFLEYDCLEKAKELSVYQKIGEPEYIADPIVFLLSEQSYWLQGQCITVDGGESL